MHPLDISPLSSQAGGRGGAGPSERGAQEVGRLRPLPPRGFTPIRGTPTNIAFGGMVPHSRGRTVAQRAGHAYERRVHDVLSAIYGEAYKEHPSMLYHDRTGLRRAIPDGLLHLPLLGGARKFPEGAARKQWILVEIKLTHCELAWWQMKRLYAPLLEVVLKSPISCVEICRSYDPSVTFPEHELINSLHKLPSNAVGVLHWRL